MRKEMVDSHVKRQRSSSTFTRGIIVGLAGGLAGTIAMHPGDTLALYTDGVVEPADARDVEFGAARLEGVLLDSRRLPASRRTRSSPGPRRATTAAGASASPEGTTTATGAWSLSASSR